MDTDTYIFGYTDADGRDEIVLCALCGGEFFKANPKEWAILRTEHAIKYPDGRKCDKCEAQVYFASAPDPRLKVYAEFLETLDT